jgi:hypothetical protein
MNPTGLSQTAPVKSGVTIKSGQVITLEWVSDNSRYEWVLADRATVLAGKQTVYVAEQESTDYGISDSGIRGVSTTGDYEVQTAWFDAGDTYNVDTQLTISTTDGQLCAVPAGAGTYPVVGKVTRIRGTGGKLLQDPANGVKDDSSTSAANSAVIIFQTGALQTVTVS